MQRLDSVDWGRLTHAYGGAADVPGLIRALSSNDEALGEMGAVAREAIALLRAALAGDVRPFAGVVDEIVIQDEAFCSAVAESIRRIEGHP